jgi:hypothetical protein
MISKALFALLVVVSLAAAWQHWRMGRLTNQLHNAEQQLSAYREATKALNHYIEKAQAANQHWQGVLRDLETKGGRDEPLNDYERAVLDSVRASGN